MVLKALFVKRPMFAKNASNPQAETAVVNFALRGAATSSRPLHLFANDLVL